MCVEGGVFIVVVVVIVSVSVCCCCCFSKFGGCGNVTKERFQSLSCQVMLIVGDAGPI